MDPAKLDQVELKMNHLHGTETSSLRIHAQSFALSHPPLLFLSMDTGKGLFVLAYMFYVNTNIYVLFLPIFIYKTIPLLHGNQRDN